MDTVKTLVARLNEQGMTDKAIAESVDSTQPTIWRIRNGVTEDCSASLYMRIAQLASTKEKTPHR
jgi:predicted transcriptional regulator